MRATVRTLHGLSAHADQTELLRWLEADGVRSNRFGDLERAWLVSALGKIGDPRALKPVSDLLRKKGGATRRAAATVSTSADGGLAGRRAAAARRAAGDRHSLEVEREQERAGIAARHADAQHVW